MVELEYGRVGIEVCSDWETVGGRKSKTKPERALQTVASPISGKSERRFTQKRAESVFVLCRLFVLNPIDATFTTFPCRVQYGRARFVLLTPVGLRSFFTMNSARSFAPRNTGMQPLTILSTLLYGAMWSKFT